MRPNQPFRSPHATGGRRTIVLASAAIGAAVLALVGVVVTVVMLSSHSGSVDRPAAAPVTTATPTTEAQAITPATTTAAASPLQGVPAMPPFAPAAGLGSNCEYTPTADAASHSVKPPRSGKAPTDPAQVAVTIKTTAGAIGVQLARNESPCTVNSFVNLAQQKFFDDTACHRLTTSPGLSVLQCGDPKGDGTGGPGYKFADEYPTDQYKPGDPAAHQPVIYPRGTLAMANSGPDTNGSQFFLVYKDSELPPNYTVFGTIGEEGLTNLDKIAAGGVARGKDDGPPATTVNINSVTVG
jgi:peptidyl-prolyl cis-trans isomerase B (cyclophilin B)